MTDVTRRDFMKAGVVTAAAMSMGRGVYAAGSEKLKVGLIGCGGRGSGAAGDCLDADPAVEIVAMGDLFKDRLDGTLNGLKTKYADRIKVNAGTSFIGFDAYKQVIGSGIDMIIEACPPHFRASHLKAAIEAGKHVFMEKPGGVDPMQIKSVIATAEVAAQKKLAIVVGTQRRHQASYLDIVKRVQDGAIGEIRAAQCYWNGGDMLGYWKWWDQEKMSEMEWQCRSWPWFVWTSGDHIVEQHVHNLDIINWVMGSHPISAMGMGGRAVRKLGNIWDHFAVEYQYPNGVRVLGMARQITGCADRISEHFVGTTGTSYTDIGGVGRIEGSKPYEYKGENPNPYVQEHKDLIKSIRDGKPLNEAKGLAESTMTAILGRMSAYTGREIKWDWAMNASKLDLSPAKYEWGPMPVDPVAVPGTTKLV
jgi:predicted dehydrogenase